MLFAINPKIGPIIGPKNQPDKYVGIQSNPTCKLIIGILNPIYTKIICNPNKKDKKEIN
ncbi:hypothetical protein J6P52_04030 [bacterium]|nr:hypothetical protein [bacterium]